MHVHIVEDEPLARRTLARHVRGLSWVSTVSESADGLQAVEFIDRHRPDILLVDIAMPGLTGLEVTQQLRYQPAVVFTTAYDAHAIAAFELGAVDYLLKPFGRDRVHKALERARRAVVGAPERLGVILRPQPLTRLFVRDGDAIVPVGVDTIEHAEAADDYVALHVPPRTYLIGTRLHDLERRLSPNRFVRVHRSHIVGIPFIARVEVRPDGRGTVLLKGGARLPVSRAGMQKLRELTS